MPDRNNQQDYWNANLDAHNLGGTASVSTKSLLEELKFSDTPDIRDMIAHLAPGSGKTILEIGAGLGANAVLMAQTGANIIALDISHDRLLALRQRTDQLHQNNWGNIHPVKAKAEALPFKPSSLDGACSRAVLIHTDIPRTISETAATLKPSAPVAFSEPMAHNPLVNLYRATLAPKEWQTITTYFTNREIEIVSSSFASALVRRYYGISFPAFAFQYALSSPRLFYATLKILRRIDRFLVSATPRLSRYAWFVLITGHNSRK